MRDRLGIWSFALIMWLAGRGWLGKRMRASHDIVFTVAKGVAAKNPSP